MSRKIDTGVIDPNIFSLVKDQKQKVASNIAALAEFVTNVNIERPGASVMDIGGNGSFIDFGQRIVSFDLVGDYENPVIQEFIAAVMQKYNNNRDILPTRATNR